MTVKIPISAELNTGDLKAALEQLTRQINTMGGAVAQANRVKFDPISRSTIEDLRRVEQSFNSLLKVSHELNRRVRATGQQGRGLFDLDWSSLYPDSGARARQMMNAFRYTTGLGFSALPSAPIGPGGGGGGVPGGGGGRPPGGPPPAPPPAPPGGGVFGPAAMAGLQAAGPVGGAAAGAVGRGGGMGAMASTFLGGLLAWGVGTAVSAVRAKIGEAEQESIGYDSLKRQLGDLGVHFNTLRESIRGASDAIDVTFQEAQTLAREFTVLSGLSRQQAAMLGTEVAIGGGFGRSFGMAPGRSNAFFAGMRGLGITANADDSRRMAMVIGETIARSGQLGRAEDVLRAVEGYAGAQARQSLTSPNIAGYGGFLSAMVGSGMVGMDPTNAAQILGRVNSAITNPGAGEAGQMFMYSALGTRFGLNPIETRILQEQGAFGTGRGAFGAGSPYAAFAGRFGLRTPGAAGSGVTNIEAVMAHLRRNYGGDPLLMADAMSNLFGLNISQSMALASVEPHGLGRLQGLLAENGVSVSSLSGTGISALAQIASGDRGTLLEQAGSLRRRTGRGALGVEEARELDRAEDAARSGDLERLRNVLIRLSAQREQEETEGSRTRESINQLDKTLQRLATGLIGPMSDVRNAVVYLAGRGRMTGRQINERVMAMERADIGAQADDEADAVRRRYGAAIGQVRARMLAPGADHRALQAEERALEAERDLALREVQGRREGRLRELEGRPISPDATERARAVAAGLMRRGVPEAAAWGLAASSLRESGANPGAVEAGGGGRGLFQWTGARREEFRRRYGVDPHEATLDQQLDFAVGELRGSERAAGQALWGARTPEQAAEIAARRFLRPADPDGAAAADMAAARRLGAGLTPLPPGAPPAAAPPVQVDIQGRFMLERPDGSPAAPPVDLRSRVTPPTPAGGYM
ncbi:hypothetical protein UFOVP326_9 [uncultured Caudovirales phage]|uniref:Phage tail lysozyme domain-containing protein n=1 Tax=uncultured Caudovirales phage TaxID=2100421 RepID=A0A6J5LTU3_9CAUD|nr:hypothetical protein UFOVP326_9 [uncultured Caudovirales phage]